MISLHSVRPAFVSLTLALLLSACARYEPAQAIPGGSAPSTPIAVQPGGIPAPAVQPPIRVQAADHPIRPGPATRTDAEGVPVLPIAGRAEVLPAQDGPADAQGRFQRLRLERRAGTKYPLVRIEEDMQRTGPATTLLRRHEMVADHLVVTMRHAGDAKAVANALPPGCSVRRLIPGSATVLVANRVVPSLELASSSMYCVSVPSSN